MPHTVTAQGEQFVPQTSVNWKALSQCLDSLHSFNL